MNDSSKIKALLKDITDHLAPLRQRLLYTAELSEEAKFLDNADIQLLVSEFVDLIKMQDSLKSEYSAIFENEEIPGSFAEIDEKIKEYDAILKDQKEFEEAKKVIERFESITSDYEKCRDMLSEYLKKLTAIETEGKSIEEYRSEVEPYDKFYEIVKITDAAAKISKSLEISNYFDGDMLSNLMFSKFYIAADNAPSGCDNRDNDDDEDEDAADDDDDVQADNDEKNDNTSDETADTSNTGLAAVDEHSEPEKEIGFLFNIKPITGYGTLEVVSKKSGVPVDQKEFKSLIKDGNNKYVIRMANESVLRSSIECFGSELNSALDKMVDSGYIESVFLEGFEKIYHINRRSYKMLVKNALNDLMPSFCEKYHEPMNYGQITVNKYFSELGMSILMSVFIKIFGELVDETFNLCFKGKSIYSGNSYNIAVANYGYKETESSGILNVSAFIENDADAEMYTEDLKELLDDIEKEFKYVFISSDSVENCGKHLELIRSLSDKTDDAEVYYYIPFEKKFVYGSETTEREAIADKLAADYRAEFGIRSEEERLADCQIVIADHSGVGHVKTEFNDSIVISDKTFKKDMENPFNVVIARRAMEYISLNTGLIHFDNIGGEEILDSLFTKGYFNRMTLEGFPPLYNYNKAFERCLNGKNIKWLKSRYKMLEFHTPNIKLLDEKTQEDNGRLTNIFLNRTADLKMTELFQPHVKAKIHESRRVGLCYSTTARIFKGKNSNVITALFICASIPDRQLLPLYFKTVSVFLEPIDYNFDYFFVGSYTKEESDSHAEYWRDKIPLNENAKEVHFSLKDDAFYLGDGSAVDIDDLIGELDELMEMNIKKPDEKPTEKSAEIPKKSGKAKEKPPEAEQKKNEPVFIPAPVNTLPQINYIPKAISELDYEQVLATVQGLLARKEYACASAYLAAISEYDRKYGQLYTELAYAMNDPAISCIYTSSMISGVFDNETDNYNEFEDYLKLCSVLRTLFLENPHDYQYKALYASIQGNRYLVDENSALSELLYLLSEFKDKTKGIGVDAFASYRAAKISNNSALVEQCSENARVYIEYYYNNPVHEKKAMPRFLDTKKMILQKNGGLYDCLNVVAENERSEEYLDYVKDFLTNNFISSENEIKSSNINSDMIYEFIDYYWDEAGKIQREKHKSSKLVQDLRTNLYQMLMKMLTEIANWYYYVSISARDDISEDYVHEKSDILNSAENALNVCSEIASSGNSNRCAMAGNMCISAVLEEMINRLKGDYLDNQNRYYYSDFLCYGEIMLNENFLPVIRNELSEIEEFSPIERILRHAELEKRDISERVDEIFNRLPDEISPGDDYGCARLIKELYTYKLDRVWDDNANDIEANIKDAVKEMKQIRNSFIGTLDFDQSNGKIDIDVKDKLLALVEQEYNYAMESCNFGFFKYMLKYCKRTVNSYACIRGAEVRELLDSVKESYADIPEARSMLETAEERMKNQDYTVVEDIINRIQQDDFANDSAIDQEDYLEDFIKRYDYIFKLVYNNPSIMTLKSRIEKFNSGKKHGNIASDIISNFPTDSRNIVKLKAFLTALGFNVDNVSQNNDKTNCFDVTVKKPLNGKRDNYLHPIYAFGSYAVEKGFRVLCLMGKNDYNNIIDAITQIGTSKNTIVIVNWALELPDRRELARKIKEQMPDDKIFIVIDRVVMYYLADNNKESTISVNRMLMQICAPFASFQPYTEDAAKAIPSEMFMGRTKLLREIESPKGANVICGGRQLGKSALLRMAKNDIDNDDVGSRAVYVEIKNLDHEKAALKVSQALIDENILDKKCLTDNWDELSRYIGLRLKDTEKVNIPYFLLLMDEADSLFESSKSSDYGPIRALEYLQTEGNERFKFVFAGLRNLVKFERELSTNENSSIPHITVKTIKPFSTREARELLEVPLYYLGIRFPKNDDNLVSLILASTNYFPGLIHQYCASLIKALQEKDYADYTVAKTPPYELTENQIKKLLSNESFTREIKRKFEITLKLDTDNYYDIITTLVAYCSYNEYSPNGFTVRKIMDVAAEYEIEKIISQGIDKLSALMDELCELNILRKNNENRYLFTRHNFIQMIGKDKEEIDEKLLQYLGG